MKGLRFGQYHGWGGIKVPMIDLLSSMPQGTGASTSGSNNQPKYESGTYTSGHNEAVHEELTKIQELEGLANVQKGLAYQAYTKGDHATMNEHIVNYQLLLNDANKYKTAVDFAKPEMERYHTRWENEESNFAHLMQNMATKDAKPFIYNAISNDDLKNMSVRDLFSLTSQSDYNPSFQNVYSKLEDRNNTLVYNPRLGRYEVGQDFGYMPDRWGKDTNFTQKLSSEFQQVASHKFQSFFGPGKISAFGKGDAISYGTLTDNYNQVANFVTNYKNWMTDDERSQLNSTSLSSYLRDKQSISVFSLSDPKEFLSTDGFKSLGVLITEEEHEYTDDKGNIVKKPSYTYTFNPYYAMFERDENMNFIANDEKTIIAGPDGKIISGVTIKDKNGKEITPNLFEHGSMNTSATDFTQGLTNIPELYLQNQVEGMKGSYLEELKDRNIKLKAEGTTSINIDMRDEVEEYLTNYWFKLQSLNSQPGTIGIVVNNKNELTWMPSNTLRGVNGGPSYLAYNNDTYNMNVKMVKTNPLKLDSPLGMKIDKNNGLWVKTNQGYTVMDSETDRVNWAALADPKIIYFTGEAAAMPKTFTNFDALKFTQSSFADHVASVNFGVDGNVNPTVKALLGGDGVNVDKSSKEYKDFMNRDEIIFTPNGYNKRIESIHSARVNNQISNEEYIYLLAVYKHAKYIKYLDDNYYYSSSNFNEYFQKSINDVENELINDGNIYKIQRGEFSRYLNRNLDLRASTERFLTMAADVKYKNIVDDVYNKKYNKNKDGTYIYNHDIFRDYGEVKDKDRLWSAMFHVQDEPWADNFHKADNETLRIKRRNEYPLMHIGAIVQISLDDLEPSSFNKIKYLPIPIEAGSADYPSMSNTSLNEIANVMKFDSVEELVEKYKGKAESVKEIIDNISEAYNKYVTKNFSNNKNKYPRVRLDSGVFMSAQQIQSATSVDLTERDLDFNHNIYMSTMYLMSSDQGTGLEGYNSSYTTEISGNNRFGNIFSWKNFVRMFNGIFIKHKQ